jgi:hypothetical protein
MGLLIRPLASLSGGPVSLGRPLPVLRSPEVFLGRSFKRTLAGEPHIVGGAGIVCSTSVSAYTGSLASSLGITPVVLPQPLAGSVLLDRDAGEQGAKKIFSF